MYADQCVYLGVDAIGEEASWCVGITQVHNGQHLLDRAGIGNCILVCWDDGLHAIDNDAGVLAASDCCTQVGDCRYTF